MAKVKKSKHNGLPHVGSYVLAAGSSASMPADWVFGTVLWAGHDDVLVEHIGPSRQVYRQVWPAAAIRATGTAEQLFEFRRACVKETEDLWRRVKEVESELGRARSDVWNRLDAMSMDAATR